MAVPITVWSIDIGQVALKAMKVRNVGEALQVDQFEVIEHSKILSQPDADRSALIRGSLEQFLSRNDVSRALIAVSVPGQSGFTRFVKLPPVDTKKIPDIVRYEAEQQIPFPIAQVHWRWQPFFDPDSPDVEVGIFAMKRADVAETLEQLDGVGLKVDIVQMAPLALCNYMTYDGQLADDGATLLVDVGADKTELVVSDGPRIWTRTIQIGGNNFTEALVRSFKLSFSKAEKLKRTAATSKYARQIFQAMRPVFADLVQEIQRSIGYYTSLHRDTRFRRLLGLGNGFRLPGLQKFLEQNLNVPVVRIDSYNRLLRAKTITAPRFHENVLSFAVGYGLAIQALGESRVRTNLLPEEIAHKRMWDVKRPWFAGAAALLVAMFAFWTFRGYADRSVLTDPRNVDKYAESAGIYDDLRDRQSEYQKWVSQGQSEKEQIAEYIGLLGYRDVWPSVLGMISHSIETVAGDDQRMLNIYYSSTEDPKRREEALKELKRNSRSKRKLITIVSLKTTVVSDVDNEPIRVEGRREESKSSSVSASATVKLRRGLRVELEATTPCLREKVDQEIIAKLREISEQYLRNVASLGFVNFGLLDELRFRGQDKSSSGRPRMLNGRRFVDEESPLGLMRSRPLGPSPEQTLEQEQGAIVPDPLFPNDPEEDMSRDTVFKVCWILSIDGGGLPDLKESAGDR